MAEGIGFIIIVLAFIPGGGRQVKEVDLRAVKLMIYRPLVFVCGALLAGLGFLISGVLSLIETWT